MRIVLHTRSPRHQRGVGTLIVVMVLFFVVSLVAAYTSRNLIFEQRTSANQYRATQALEAAEAGLEWAISMLNHGRITASCTTSTTSTDTTFRQRYLNVNAAAGTITVLPNLFPTCVFNGTDWSCSCPASGPATPATPTGGDVYPAFRVHFVQVTTPPATVVVQPGVVRVEVNGCTRLSDDCLNFVPTALANEGRAYVSALVALTGGAASMPKAAVTAYGAVTLSGGGIYNADVAVQAGGTPNTGAAQLIRAAGSPGGSAVVGPDTTLSVMDVSRVFPAVFNMWSATYRTQPAAVVLNCSAVTCDAATLRDTVLWNPGRPIWVNGDLVIDTAGDIGSATAPVVLVVTGDISVDAAVAAAATIHGLLYVQRTAWTDMGAVHLRGAVVAEGNISAGTPQITYDPALLNVTRNTVGSFVRVPGGWRDFPEE